MSSFYLGIKQDAKIISSKLTMAKRKDAKDHPVDWKFFVKILRKCLYPQIEEFLNPDGSHVTFIKEIKVKYDLDVSKKSHKHFISYKIIGEIFTVFPLDIENYDPEIPDQNFVGHTISQIRGGNHPGKIPPFLAWLWRDHEDEAKKLYDLLGLEQYRTYDHQEIQDYINNPSLEDKAGETQVNSASSTAPVHPQPQPIHTAPVTQKRQTMRFAYKAIREGDDYPFHPANMPFFGRESELKHLDDFINCKHDVALWAVAGSSGTGKTRLIQHWMIHSEAMPVAQWDQWVLGTEFTPFDGKDYDSWEPDYPILIVIDYLHVHQQALESILERCKILNRRGVLKHKPVRIMLIDHVFPENLSDLAGNPRYGMKNIDENDFGDCPYIFDTPLKLAAKTSLDADNKETITDTELDEIIPLILRESAGGNVISDIQDKAISYLKNLPNGYYPLFAILIGYTLKKAKERGEDLCFETWNRRQLIAEYFKRHKRLPWTEEYGEEGKWAAACVAVATVRRGVPWDLLEAHIPCHEVDFPTVQAISRQIVSSYSDLDILTQYEPDIMGETFFLMFMKELSKGGKDFLDVKKSIFLMIFSENDSFLHGKLTEFFGFFTRLTRNLCNDNQEDLIFYRHWEIIQWFFSYNSSREDITYTINNLLLNIIIEIEKNLIRKNRHNSLIFDLVEFVINRVDIVNLCRKSYPEEALIDCITTCIKFSDSLCRISHKFHKIEYDYLYDIMEIKEIYSEILLKKNENLLTISCREEANYIAESLVCFFKGKNKFNSVKASPLVASSENGNIKMVKLLLSERFPVDQVNAFGWNSVMAASYSGKRNIVDLLISIGADVNHKCYGGSSPLILACKYSHENVVISLLDNGANINYMDPCSQKTPLMYACENGNQNLAHMLIEKGADIDHVNFLECTPLISACESGNKDLVSMLIDKGADINIKADEDYGPLEASCEHKNTRIFDLLIEKGIIINHETTAIMEASRAGSIYMINKLLKKGCDVNVRSLDDYTPIFSAAVSGCINTVRTLIKHGADINAVNIHNESALTYALKHNHQDIAYLLRSKGAINPAI